MLSARRAAGVLDAELSLRPGGHGRGGVRTRYTAWRRAGGGARIWRFAARLSLAFDFYVGLGGTRDEESGSVPDQTEMLSGTLHR